MRSAYMPSFVAVCPEAEQCKRFLDNGFKVMANPGSENTPLSNSEQRRLVFVDCEFTSLEDPKLLSIALVADDGTELYVELAGDSHLKRASTFVIDTVVPQFGRVPYAEISRIDIGKRVGAWLQELRPSTIDILHDFHADMDLLEGSLRAAAIWTRLKAVLVPTHIGYLIGETDVATAMETSWGASFAVDGIERHHALADARALRAGYLAMHGGGQTAHFDK